MYLEKNIFQVLCIVLIESRLTFTEIKMYWHWVFGTIQYLSDKQPKIFGNKNHTMLHVLKDWTTYYDKDLVLIVITDCNNTIIIRIDLLLRITQGRKRSEPTYSKWCLEKIKNRFPDFENRFEALLLTLNCTTLFVKKKTKQIPRNLLYIETAIFVPGTIVEPNSFENLFGFLLNGRLKSNELSTYVVIERKPFICFQYGFRRANTNNSRRFRGSRAACFSRDSE